MNKTSPFSSIKTEKKIAIFTFVFVCLFSLNVSTAIAGGSNNNHCYHNCNKNTPPTITVIGANPATITVNTTYTDLGAMAIDKEDGDLTSSIISTSTVNTTVVGTYTVTYSVEDSEGLTATTTRKVDVLPVVVPPPTPIPPPIATSTATIVATKIVCNSETDLPNWGAGGPNISSTTATDFVGSHSTCHLESGWQFQWSFGDEIGKTPAPVLPGDFVGVATTTSGVSSWNTFGSTDSNGVASTSISNLNGASKIWVREVLQTGYIPFSYPSSTSSVSAELYCHKDTLRYDNYDYISPATLGQTYYCVAWNVLKTPPPTPVNNPPVIKVIGANPATTTVNTVYIDLGATATDQEDGNITANIITTNNVSTSTVGTYVVTYSVTDTGGLTATTTRTVNVAPDVVVPPTNTGKITFCMMIADNQNVVATTSADLPTGLFVLSLATSTSFGSSTINSKTWNTNSFAVNTGIINMAGVDAECTTFDNLPLGTYYYSELSINGSAWVAPKYNDQSTQSINNIFDFFPYSPALFTATTTDDSLRDMNADGQIVISIGNKERTLVVLNKFNPVSNQCLIPQINSSLTATATVGQAFSYTITATTTTATTTPFTFDVATSTLPGGFSFATTTNTISGTPTQTGTFNIQIKAGNICGLDTQTLVLTVNPVPPGGGGGGGSPSSNLSIVKTSDKTTANVGDTITYTIKVLNGGPNDATLVAVGEVLPSTLNFVSASSSVGSYSTTTSLWTIGGLFNNASTTLTIVATVKASTEGQTINNIVAVSGNEGDPSTGDNTSNVVVTVNNPGGNPTPTPTPTSPTCTSNCGGGGGGGPIYPNTLTIFNESVVETIPGVAMVTWNTNLPATRRVVYDTVSHPIIDTSANLGYPKSTELVSTPLLTLHGMAVSVENNKTYYFREISTDVVNGVTRTAIGKEVSLTVGVPTIIGGGVGGDQGSNSCYYLYDYLRKDFNNNPIEVKKLQVFLRDLEGFTAVQVTGIYDDQTIVALNAFQERYKGDILTPWGHTEATAYTYILTKKKVNEIYCKKAFPVTPLQQSEIDAFRNFLLGLKNAGVDVPKGPRPTPTPQVISNDIIGKATTSTSTVGGLIGSISSTTSGIVSRFTANAFSAGNKVAGWFDNMNGWINLALLAIIAVISYLWYKEYNQNKKIEIINKEIDLE